MFGIGFGELVVIFIVALLVIGPDKLPEIAKTAGRFLANFRKTQQQIKLTLEKELNTPVNEINQSLNKTLNDISANSDLPKQNDDNKNNNLENKLN